jgi:hypothetical protein
MGSIRKRLSARKSVDQQEAADQEAAKTMQAEPETMPAETDQAAGGSDEPRTPPQQDGSE